MTLDWFCGRTFDHGDTTFTVVSFTDDDSARCHVSDGRVQAIPLALLREALRAGAIVESMCAPFTHARDPRLRVYVAGPHKRPMKGI